MRCMYFDLPQIARGGRKKKVFALVQFIFKKKNTVRVHLQVQNPPFPLAHSPLTPDNDLQEKLCKLSM